MSDDDEKHAVVRQALHILGEHFDSAAVFVTWSDADITKTLMQNTGNWYATQGFVMEWAQQTAEQISEHAGDVEGEDI